MGDQVFLSGQLGFVPDVPPGPPILVGKNTSYYSVFRPICFLAAQWSNGQKIVIYRRTNCSLVQVEGGITPEAEKTFENAEAVLEAAGATME